MSYSKRSITYVVTQNERCLAIRERENLSPGKEYIVKRESDITSSEEMAQDHLHMEGERECGADPEGIGHLRYTVLVFRKFYIWEIGRTSSVLIRS